MSTIKAIRMEIAAQYHPAQLIGKEWPDFWNEIAVQFAYDERDLDALIRAYRRAFYRMQEKAKKWMEGR